MIVDMETLRLSEAELVRDLHAVLAKVREGAEILVAADNRVFAVIRSPHSSGRPVSEILRLAKERD